jgi:hypothetical protein
VKKRFILCVDGCTKEEQNSLSQYFRAQRPVLGFWHYYSDMWLIVDVNDVWTHVTLRDKMIEILPNKSIFITGVTEGSLYAMRGRKDSFGWFKTQWEPDSE